MNEKSIYIIFPYVAMGKYEQFVYLKYIIPNKTQSLIVNEWVKIFHKTLVTSIGNFFEISPLSHFSETGGHALFKE